VILRGILRGRDKEQGQGTGTCLKELFEGTCFKEQDLFEGTGTRDKEQGQGQGV
jgi:hypothetical protein